MLRVRKTWVGWQMEVLGRMGVLCAAEKSKARKSHIGKGKSSGTFIGQ